MTYYSREITAPKTKKEGLLNFMQMIINAAEAGDAKQALMLAVDLQSDLASSVNPYAECLEGDARYVTAEVAEQQAATAFEKGREAGRVAAKQEAKAELQKLLAAA